ncbi:AI-2E family transporter [Adhaeribacter rhizoryzae]|uniref:AI-2E family transporter n=1 Tax=Adhaeribacter rhizoryzae TaxID=2607907 RepID=A0A5M6DNF2_9BACT|nr:AI-2E family transporter [Adhaeribacter rhizoryzae]KAA5547710.1 AI-2E family transporter [Adhaeribacter rhizoryzae]
MELKLPDYLKYTIILLGLILLLYLLQMFQSFLVPILFSMLFALLLLPISERLERKMPRSLAIITSLIFIVLVLGLLIYLLSMQIASFSEEMKNISDKLLVFVNKIQQFLFQKFGIQPTSKNELLSKNLTALQETGTRFLGSTISVTTGALSVITLVPIYIFCMLYYRDHFRRFIFQCISRDKRDAFMTTMDNIQKVVESYISGLMIVIVIVAILNTVGLMIMGVPYAIFFGAFAAVLTIIPYIGILIGALLPAMYTLIQTGSLLNAVIVIGIFTFVQFLEGNFITPNITGSKVSINPFAAILALIIGGEIWGAAGMILSIPVIAMLKVVFDAYEPLRPIGFVLGDTNQRNAEPGFFNKLINRFKKKVKEQPSEQEPK